MKKLITNIIGTYFNIGVYFFPKKIREQAFSLLCKVKPIPVSKEAATYFKNTTYLKTDFGDAALHSWGNGTEKILFLHGWLSYSIRWKPYIDQLDTSKYTIYSLDAPGHGFGKEKYLNIEVYRQAYANALAEIGEVDTVITHSLGGLVAGYGFLENPSISIKKYCIMGAPADMNAIFDYSKKILSLSDKMVEELLIKANEILKLPTSDITMKTFFSNVKKPVLVVHDTHDKITPIEPIKRAINNDTATYFTENQGHNLRDNSIVETVIAYIKN
ncbi:alpha/beta hydrolase [Patiriisocius hiemis]|uniref:Alpha/beta hydrolase n=1 Tax=Patiriisocius hiemis TaxID=3075604 RepID=A0ABU2YFE1_9FLAO|nr:alpha/beta hydrolase [Constantimarinum sp. W242]MDT0556500.1 alpha/beta hydrolase [Constantimarinum sp. W242]